MKEHTKGPWVAVFDDERECSSWSIHAVADDDERATICHTSFEWLDETRANAARIVACVNAMEGIADPAAFVEAANKAFRVIAKQGGTIERVAQMIAETK